jgi:fructosamine-3-kinase
MPRVRQQRKSARGVRICGRTGCGKEIQKGEMYYTWSFRYGGRQVRCLDHPPKQSELTQSKLSQVYEAIESFNEEFGAGADNLDDLKAGMENVAEQARTVVDEYTEAAEPFGGAGENAERAEQLEGWVDELDNFDTSEWEEEEGFDEDIVGSQLAQEMFGLDTVSALSEEQRIDWQGELQNKREEWDAEHSATSAEKMQEALDAAQALLDEMPL